MSSSRRPSKNEKTSLSSSRRYVSPPRSSSADPPNFVYSCRKPPSSGQDYTLKRKQKGFQCKICFERFRDSKLFSVKGCNHVFCSDCIASYVESKLAEKKSNIKCPDLSCKETLELDSCRSILAPDVIYRWGVVLCESLIREDQKFYCPFKDCSALLVNDETGIIRESECPICRRLFCAQCKVPWHSEMRCIDFQNSKINKKTSEDEDMMVLELAKKKKWQRCPKCCFFVERNQGCSQITCRCGIRFCYKCASPLENHHLQNCNGLM